MTRWSFRQSFRSGGELWLVAALLLAIAVPTLGVLGFVGEAIKNEGLANQQRLADAYQANLQTVQQRFDEDLTKLLRDVRSISQQPGADRTFHEIVSWGTIDSVVLLDPNDSSDRRDKIAPSPMRVPSDLWKLAKRKEDQPQHREEARELYRKISAQTDDVAQRLLAFQAEVRCAFETGGQLETIKRLRRELETINHRDLSDPQAVRVLANLRLVAIEQLGDSSNVSHLVALLLELLGSDQNSFRPSQRLFLLHQLDRLFPDQVNQRLLDAERLASRWWASEQKLDSVDQVPPNRFMPSGIANVFQLATANRQAVVLMRSDRFAERIDLAISQAILPRGVEISLLQPNDVSAATPIAMVHASERLPQWRIVLTPSTPTGQTLPHRSGRVRTSIYVGTATVLVTVSLGLAMLVARGLRRKIRMANLKNDLVGTVSHELKTPLSSMRLLVDTLIHEENLDQPQTREYLGLIADENERLSRLVENFLTFSKLRENPMSLQLEPVSMTDVVTAAIDNQRDRLASARVQLITRSTAPPVVQGDRGALITVVTNLLDNAYKYSQPPQQIDVVLERIGDEIELSVTDNGQGLSQHAANRVFDKFYQVDQSLHRAADGCGLGLSIVESIVKAHSGSIRVNSRVDQGSTFTVSLPRSPDTISNLAGNECS